MTLWRRLLRNHRCLAAFLVALALCMKAIVPAGHMIAPSDRLVTIAICTDATGGQTTRQLAIPMKPGSGKEQPGHESAQAACAWSSLSAATLAGAEPALLALALLFILTLGFLAVPALPNRHRRHAWPPLRGPPLPA